MKKVLLTSATALVFGGTLGGAAFAQNSFPDVPSSSYAADAVSQLAELGIVNGFPDGTFRGNEAFTRYQAALVVSRLLSVIDENRAAAGALSQEDLATVNNAIAELRTQLGSLTDRISALENAPQGGEALNALTQRVTALEQAAPPGNLADTVTALEGRVAALEQAPAPAAPGPDLTALQDQVTALNQQVNSLQEQLATVSTQSTNPPAPTPQEPSVNVTSPAAPAPVAVNSGRGKFHFGVGGAYEIGYTNSVTGGGALSFLDGVRIRPRVIVGVDNIVSGFGIRAAADYGRQSLIDSGSLAVSGHLTYTLGSSGVSGYLGVGGGYQFADLIAASGVNEGSFAGALLGAEFGNGPITFFVEGTADYYFDAVTVTGYSQDIYPTVAVGFNLRP